MLNLCIEIIYILRFHQITLYQIKNKRLDIPNFDILRVANNKLVAWNVYAAEKECEMV